MNTDMLNIGVRNYAPISDTMTAEEQADISIIEHYIGKPYTSEQREFIRDFRRNIISFSNPGTGKTHTLVGGIIMATKCHGVQPSRIFCMSFTNAAVEEIKGRYKVLTEKVKCPRGCTIATFHSLAGQIMRDAYPTMRTRDNSNSADTIEEMCQYMEKLDFFEYNADKVLAKKIIKVIESLNSSFVYEREHVENSYEFKKLEIPFEEFESLRRSWFMKGVIQDAISPGDIPQYCLYALLSDPTIANKWLGKYDVMIVDEFQDLSLIHLQILSRVAKTLIVVGDMKQQIYAFNGSSPDIVEAYMRERPDAVVCNLTKSFRCSQKISEFATNIIKQNDPNIEAFTGWDVPSSIQFIKKENLDWSELLKDVGQTNTYDYLILYRNNASVIPIIEELYSRGIPYRIGKGRSVSATDIPVIKSLCALVDAAWQPYDQKKVQTALMLFPEFRQYGYNQPVLSAMQSSNKSVFDVRYKYQQQSSLDILNAMKLAAQRIKDGKSAGTILNGMREVYRKYIYPKEWFMLSYDEEYYINMAAHVCNGRTYPDMVRREELKKIKANECNQAGYGVRCYTIHSAKGLEADKVFILDCEEGLFPNAKTMKDKVDKKCLYEVAVDIRSERNLLYVALTRAKTDVVISYVNTPSLLLTDPENDLYTSYDRIYSEQHKIYDDATAFYQMYNQKG